MGSIGFKLLEEKHGHLSASGVLDIYNLNQARKIFAKKLLNSSGVIIDLSKLEKLDTTGTLLLQQIKNDYNVKFQHIKRHHAQLFEFIGKVVLTVPVSKRHKNVFVSSIINLGTKYTQTLKGAAEFTTFLGQICVTFVKSSLSAKHLRLAAIMHHIEEAGIKAIPIISIMAFMIAIVLAYQGVAQLKPLGVESLTINLVAISVLREMGVLITAIMIAGRSGSAFTAEIGVMKIREEVDALQVMGISPFEVLVLPRIIALFITLPLLTFIADIMGLLGGGVISMLLVDIPMETYIDRVHAVVSGNDFMVGMIKAPVFALLIALVGCMHGMRVSGSAEALGTETTASVVKSIFLVIVADALFSILFEKIGI